VSPFSYPCLVQKNTKHKGYEYRPTVLQPKQSCWNVRSLLSGLGGATCGQRAVKSPWMLQVFQAEIWAILACAHEIQFQVDQKSTYLPDSQAALKALQAARTSPLVQQCQKALNDISTWHTVGLYWVPGHWDMRK